MFCVAERRVRGDGAVVSEASITYKTHGSKVVKVECSEADFRAFHLLDLGS